MNEGIKDIYLTDLLKEKYKKDFFENVIIGKDWPLDKGISDILSEINGNPNIQSLYSKKDNPETGGDGESYLEFCYKKECELTIFRKLVPMFLEKFNSDPNSQFKYRFNYPSTNPNFHKGSPKTGLLCRDDEDYFLINNIRFVLNSYNSNVHDEFWQEIRNHLKCL